MYETSDLIATAILAALIGLIVGVAIFRSMGSSSSKVRELEQKLEREQEKGLQYKSDVTQHFSETASLLTDLTLKYKDIHDHLANGADQLCRDEQGKLLLEDSPAKLRIEEQSSTIPEEEEEIFSPPLDYAPKTNTATRGQLAEDFGLEKVKLEEDIVENPVPGAFAASESIAQHESGAVAEKT